MAMVEVELINWHRIFGIGLTDYFLGTSNMVELERDLSAKQQFLDAAILLTGEPLPLVDPCDGLEDLCPFNLVTYKSGHEPLNADALDELGGYYTGYRKLLDGKMTRENTLLLAIATCYPAGLNRTIPLEEIKQGVYLALWGDRFIKIIVPKRTEKVPRNAFWHLHSWEQPLVEYGLTHYKWKSQGYSSILELLDEGYREEGLRMYTMEDFEKEAEQKVLNRVTPEQLGAAIPADKLAVAIPTEKLAAMPADKLTKALLQNYSPAEIKRMLDQG